MTVAGREIRMPLFGPALILHPLVVHESSEAQATASARVDTRTVIRQPEEFQGTPIAGPRDVDHGLPQLHFAVGMFEEVDLVDDIDQVLRFGNAPEHPVHAQPHLPFALAELAEQQSIRFPQIPMGAD